MLLQKLFIFLNFFFKFILISQVIEIISVLKYVLKVKYPLK